MYNQVKEKGVKMAVLSGYIKQQIKKIDITEVERLNPPLRQ
jgi:hypothetical protein